MKYLAILSILFLISCTSSKEKLPVAVIPKPNKLEVKNGYFKLSEKVIIGMNSDEIIPVAEQFMIDLQEQVSFQLSSYKDANIKLKLNGNSKDESYSLNIEKNGIEINSNSKQGIYYALQTLKQLILFSELKRLPKIQIEDAPRFGWRGLMLDESRYFFGVEKVKQILDLMAMHKLDVFHWHLTDDPGWRIEIKQYPKLTTIGGIGNDIEPNAQAKFYTQEEVREIVQYAAERYIEVIPEIDMPGHAKAANMAYPEFSGGGSKTHPEFTFNPGYEGTYTYLTNILKEVIELFPSDYIHLGGDEVHFGNHAWNTNRHVQKLMQEEGLENLKQVEKYFVHRMADSIKMLGKTVIGWDEIVDHELPNDNSMVMWWRHNKPESLENALTKDYNVILCPRIPLYFDFDQHKNHQYGRKWKGEFSPVDMVYHFPPDTLPAFTEKYSFIKGLQANIWTERVQDNNRLEYLTHPRLSALAEASWTSNNNKNYDSFKRRLLPMLKYFEKLNVEYFNPLAPELTPEPVGLFRRNIEQKRR